jgi:hypothetical protein
LGCSADIEAVGIGKVFRVAVGGGDGNRDEIALLHRHAAERGTRNDAAVAELVRALEAQHLLDGSCASARDRRISRAFSSGHCRSV